MPDRTSPTSGPTSGPNSGPNSGPRRPRSRALAALVLALVAALVLAGCGGSDDKESKKLAERPKSQPTQGGTTLAALWPLTGLPAPGKTPDYPVYAVKIPNTAASYPQVGMSQADMVSEELVEGGITRLAVFFYSKLPALVGPVRSMRASDIGIVKPLHATIVSSGAAPPTLARLNKAGVHYYTGGPGYFRDSSSAPYNLMVRMKELAKAVKYEPIVPASYLPWGTDAQYAGKGVARSVNAKFSGGHTTKFRFQKGRYTNINSYAPAADQYHPDSILVLRVRQGDAGYLDPAGNPVPETLFSGTGNVVLFHGGKVLRGTWHKDKLDGVLKLRTKAGKAMTVPAGHVWIELLPTDRDGGRLTWGR